VLTQQSLALINQSGTNPREQPNKTTISYHDLLPSLLSSSRSRRQEGKVGAPGGRNNPHPNGGGGCPRKTDSAVSHDKKHTHYQSRPPCLLRETLPC